MVLLFGFIGVYGAVRALALIGRVDYTSIGLLLFLAVITGRTKVRLVGGSSLSLITTVALISVMMHGPWAGVLVGVCGVAVQCMIPWRNFIPHHPMFNIGMIVVTIGLASSGYYAVVRDYHTAGVDRLFGSM